MPKAQSRGTDRVFLVTGVVVMLVNLIVDLCYGYLDPKVRFDR